MAQTYDDNSSNYRDWTTRKLKVAYMLLFDTVENGAPEIHQTFKYEHIQAILKKRRVRMRKELVIR